MTDEQFNQITKLLEKIIHLLEHTETNTGDLSDIKENTKETKNLLKDIKEK